MVINDTPDICKERALLEKQQEADWQKLKVAMDNLREAEAAEGEEHGSSKEKAT